MSLEEMCLRNELKRLEPSAGEIDRLLDAIARRLEDARNLTIHAKTRLEWLQSHASNPTSGSSLFC